MKAKDTAAWEKQYPLTNAAKLEQQKVQLKKYLDSKKGK